MDRPIHGGPHASPYRANTYHSYRSVLVDMTNHVKKYFLIQVSYAFIYGSHLMVSKKIENMCACYTSEMKRTIIIYEVNLSIKNMLRYVSL